MNKKGRDYVRRTSNRPGDLYDSPMCTLWTLLEKESFNNCLEPASGNGSLLKAAPSGMFTHSFDLLKDGTNFLDCKEIWNGDIITNPPFSIWDLMVTHAKQIATGRICMIGKTNFFGCVGRYNSDIWNNLEWVYIFNRYIDYQTPYREDGLCHVGNMCTGWFIWDKRYTGNPKIRLLDVSKYAVLGNYKKGSYA
jgi:hypothetical protein